MAGQEIERLMAVAEPPLTVARLEHEALSLENSTERLNGVRIGRGQTDGNVVSRAVNDNTVCWVAIHRIGNGAGHGIIPCAGSP